MIITFDLSRRVKDSVQDLRTKLKKLTKVINKRNLTIRRKAASVLLLANITTLTGVWSVLPGHGLIVENTHVFAQEEVKQTDEGYDLVLKPKSFDFIALADDEVEVNKTESRAQEKDRKAREERRKQFASVALTSIAEPSLEVKRALAKQAAAAYGIDWKLVEAVWQVESGKKWHTSVRSSAGAQGPMQFMPGTWRRYQADGNGDGTTNIHDARDAVFSGAKYLAANGAQTNINQALFAYNHANWYVEKVKKVAESIIE